MTLLTLVTVNFPKNYHLLTHDGSCDLVIREEFRGLLQTGHTTSLFECNEITHVTLFQDSSCQRGTHPGI